jgi:SAM-dependent methyltransferase
MWALSLASILKEGTSLAMMQNNESVMKRILRCRPVRRFVCQPFLRANKWGWKHAPAALISTRAVRRYGDTLQTLVRLSSSRGQLHGTFFLRNRPELDLLRSLAMKQPQGATLKIAVVACSNGAEVYSILWTLRSARPDLRIALYGIDISKEVVAIAREGKYPLETQKLIGSPIFQGLTAEEMGAMFYRNGDQMEIREWLKEGIEWYVADAGDPELRSRLGPMDIVVANKFLCHMEPVNAEKCLRAVALLVAPGGHLFVSGIDLEVRTKVALELSWRPVRELLEDIHDGDLSVRRDWPWRYWGLEPIDRKKRHWEVRYASVFQIGMPSVEEVQEVREVIDVT